MPSKPSIIRTDAVVLRAMDFGETSKIVTLFTHEFGKMGVMARGARKSKRRFGSVLEPLSHIQAIIYVKPSRELQSLTEASHVRTYPTIRESLQRIEIGLRVIELTNSLMQAQQKNFQIFALLVSVLTALDGSEERFENLLPFYQLRFASILGFAPAFEKVVFDGMKEEGGMIALHSGEIQTDSHEEGGYRATRSILRAFAILSRAPLSDVMRMSLRPEVKTGVDALIASYMKYHFEEAYPSRSEKVFSQFEKG